MELRIEYFPLLHIMVTLWGLHMTSAQSNSDRDAQQQGGYAYSYNNQQGQGQGQQQFDYTYSQGQPEQPRQTICYHCIYMVKAGKVFGPDNCRDPFRKEGINEVGCESPCAKIYQKNSEMEYTLTRGCLKNCVPSEDNNGYVRCCDSHLCNGASRTARSAPSRAVTAAALLALFYSLAT